jgi:hypothetical protein
MTRKSIKRISGLDEYYKELAKLLSCEESDLSELDGDGKHINSYFGTNELMFETKYLGLIINNIFIGDISLVTDIEGNKYVMEKSKDGSIKIFSNSLDIPILNIRINDIRLTALNIAVQIVKVNPMTDVIKLSKKIEDYITGGL